MSELGLALVATLNQTNSEEEQDDEPKTKIKPLAQPEYEHPKSVCSGGGQPSSNWLPRRTATPTDSLPRFRMVAYTGAPMRIAGWRYPVVIDLAGMAIPSQSRPIRFSHDASAGVGHTDASASRRVNLWRRASSRVIQPPPAKWSLPVEERISVAGIRRRERRRIRVRQGTPNGDRERTRVRRPGQRRSQVDAQRNQLRGSGSRRSDQRERCRIGRRTSRTADEERTTWTSNDTHGRNRDGRSRGCNGRLGSNQPVTAVDA